MKNCTKYLSVAIGALVIIVFAVTVDVASAAPTNPQSLSVSADETVDPRPDTCWSLQGPTGTNQCDSSVITLGTQSSEWSSIMRGDCDTTAIADFIISKGDDFEPFMYDYLHLYSTATTNGEVLWFESLIGKLNALVGPILQTALMKPGQSIAERQNLYEQIFFGDLGITLGDSECNPDPGNCENNYCASPPLSVSFPYLGDVAGFQWNNNYDQNSQVPYQVTGTYWSLDYEYEDQSAYTVSKIMVGSDDGNCEQNNVSYNKKVVATTTSSSTYAFTDANSSSMKWTSSASFSDKLDGLGVDLSEKITTSVTDTITSGFTTTTKQTQTTSNAVTFQTTADVPSGATVNVTMTFEQVAANVTWTNNGEFSPTEYVVPTTSDVSLTSTAVHLPQLSTETLKTAINRAVEVWGWTWSDNFIDQLVTASIGGTAETKQGGDTVNTYTLACNTTDVPVGSCNQKESEEYPVNVTSC
eukprot:Clim_evm8s158 gene=Clim_evmTU8s158